VLRVAVLIKQVPVFEQMSLDQHGRLRRDGEGEMNPYCRRAVSKGVELARASGGSVTAITLGPATAQDVLREAIAWGADDGVLVSDPAFAGSDTLASARALAAVIQREGPFGLILVGRNSVDADTGQVGPQLAELLGLPFAAAARTLEVTDTTARVRSERDDGWRELTVPLPAVLSCAERLCEPCKVPADVRAQVDATRIRTVTAADLGAGPWGQAGSPTRVGQIRILEIERQRLVLSGPLDRQVGEAADLIRANGSIVAAPPPSAAVPPPVTCPRADIAVLAEPGHAATTRELLGAAALLAHARAARVVVLGPGPAESDELSRWGADEIVPVAGAESEEVAACAGADWVRSRTPWAVLAPGTMWGREVASRIAASTGSGLVGDAVELECDNGRLVAWKPAFGGHLVAAITSDSAVQLATVRPGILATLGPRPVAEIVIAPAISPAKPRVVIERGGTDDQIGVLQAARAVLGVGRGVRSNELAALEPLRVALGAEFGATRKITDEGWLPHARQIGLTGHAIAPDLYVVVGASGKFNHMVGVRAARTIVAINEDPSALVFRHCDIGIVGDWHEVVPLLAEALSQQPPGQQLPGQQLAASARNGS
jgi:electron transfer flavoprotein alpha subunit